MQSWLQWKRKKKTRRDIFWKKTSRFCFSIFFLLAALLLAVSSVSHGGEAYVWTQCYNFIRKLSQTIPPMCNVWLGGIKMSELQSQKDILLLNATTSLRLFSLCILSVHSLEPCMMHKTLHCRCSVIKCFLITQPERFDRHWLVKRMCISPLHDGKVFLILFLAYHLRIQCLNRFDLKRILENRLRTRSGISCPCPITQQHYWKRK